MGLGKLLTTTAAFKQAGRELPGAASASDTSTASLSDHDPVPHHEQRPLLHADTGVGRGRGYGGVESSSRRVSPEAYRNRSASLPKVVEDEDGDDGEDEEGRTELDDEEFLEERGLYVGASSCPAIVECKI